MIAYFGSISETNLGPYCPKKFFLTEVARGIVQILSTVQNQTAGPTPTLPTAGPRAVYRVLLYAVYAVYAVYIGKKAFTFTVQEPLSSACSVL